MTASSGSTLSVAGLFAERDARRRHDQEAAEQLQRRKEEELTAFRQRLENFQLTDEVIKSGLDRIKRAFERGESELMFSSFPCDFCADGGRAVINAGVPPINRSTKEQAARQGEEPDWLLTMPAGVRKVHEYWRQNLKPGGFGFAARIINYPGGKPGDIGLFFTWPKSALEAQARIGAVSQSHQSAQTSPLRSWRRPMRTKPQTTPQGEDTRLEMSDHS